MLVYWRFIWLLVFEGLNDIFIVEDLYQCIYGYWLVLFWYGIMMRGCLWWFIFNYCIIVQIFRWLIYVLEGGFYVDFDGDDDDKLLGYWLVCCGFDVIVYLCMMIIEEFDYLVKVVG